MAATNIPQEPICTLRRLQESLFPSKTKKKHAYPPISSIPRTSPARLAAAAVVDPTSADSDSATKAAAAAAAADTASNTILYLAYGSNLSAETFLGVRGIRPVSQVVVSAPTLTLVFDLPGLPYREPCFANTAVRKVPPPKMPDPPKNPPKFPLPPPSAPSSPSAASLLLQQRWQLSTPQLASHTGSRATTKTATKTPDLGWDKGLYGVVYEVTPEDYATIVATEGGGSSYADILVPCFAVPPPVSVPEKPPIDLPLPFLAHTLHCPSIPDTDDDDGDDNNNITSNISNINHNTTTTTTTNDNDDGPKDPRKKWYWRLLRPPHRPRENYAQPSPRYLKLITDGAAEHELPDDYQRWLGGLRPYRPTTARQRVAQWLLTAALMPVLLVFFWLNKAVAKRPGGGGGGGGAGGGGGRLPLWIGIAMGVLFNLVWMFYDAVLKPVFGDGERTIEDGDGDGDGDDDDDEGKEMGMGRKKGWFWRCRGPGTDEEKVGLLDGVE